MRRKYLAGHGLGGYVDAGFQKERTHYIVCSFFLHPLLSYRQAMCPAIKNGERERKHLYIFYLGKFSDGIGERAINTKVQYEQGFEMN